LAIVAVVVTPALAGTFAIAIAAIAAIVAPAPAEPLDVAAAAAVRSEPLAPAAARPKAVPAAPAALISPAALVSPATLASPATLVSPATVSPTAVLAPATAVTPPVMVIPAAPVAAEVAWAAGTVSAGTVGTRTEAVPHRSVPLVFGSCAPADLLLVAEHAVERVERRAQGLHRQEPRLQRLLGRRHAGRRRERPLARAGRAHDVDRLARGHAQLFEGRPLLFGRPHQALNALEAHLRDAGQPLLAQPDAAARTRNVGIVRVDPPASGAHLTIRSWSGLAAAPDSGRRAGTTRPVASARARHPGRRISLGAARRLRGDRGNEHDGGE